MRPYGTIATVFLLAVVGFSFDAPRTPSAQPASKAAGSIPDVIFVETPLAAAGQLTARFPRGSRLVRLNKELPAQSVTGLTDGFFAAADPQVSFDSTRVLFSAQKARGDRWQIWEMSADGTGKRQITHCSGDCLRPAFLPRNQIAFTIVRGKAPGEKSEIYVSKSNGEDAHPITFGPGNFQVETVLQDGRILVSADSRLVTDQKGHPSRAFYSLRPDGSGLSLYRQEEQPDVVRSGADELEDGTILFIKRQDAPPRDGGGQLAWIRPGALHNSVISSPHSAFWSVRLLDGNALVVSMQEPGSPAGSSRYALYLFDLSTRSVRKKIYGNSKYSSVQAVPLEPRPVPRYYWSVLHPKRNYGRVVCLDSYLSAGAPHGRLATRIARVQVIALQPDHRSELNLGEAPVESDGSFYIKVPADQPIRFKLLDAKGAVIRAQRSWIWARTGEDVGCVGCHESKAIVPQDHWPLALKRFDTPVPLGVPARGKRGLH